MEPPFRLGIPVATQSSVVLGAVEGQAAEILEQANAGICVAPENADELANAITVLYRDSGLRGRLGANGRAYILEHLTRAQTAAKYLVVLESVLKDAEAKRRLRPEPQRPARAKIAQNAGVLVPMKPL
jgi:glycosyltransferase involved in cell wall biosynthesis